MLKTTAGCFLTTIARKQLSRHQASPHSPEASSMQVKTCREARTEAAAVFSAQLTMSRSAGV